MTNRINPTAIDLELTSLLSLFLLYKMLLIILIYEREGLPMWFLRLLVKILILPIILILSIVSLLGKLLTYLSCYVVGIFMILVVLCIIVSILDKSVTNMFINIAFGVIAYGMVFAIAICCEIISETNGKLIRFLAS